MDPILIDVPDRLVTEQLVLRAPRAGDGPKVWEATVASLAELRPWMPWATGEPEADESERFARSAGADFIARRDLVFYGFARGAGDEEGPVLVACGLHRMDWQVRRFEIGYWRRTGFGGLGLVDEAVPALERNTKLQPMSPYGWYQLARVHMDRHEPEKARKIIRHLKGFEPKVAAQLERETGLTT